jgi:hypothetical protein
MWKFENGQYIRNSSIQSIYQLPSKTHRQPHIRECKTTVSFKTPPSYMPFFRYPQAPSSISKSVVKSGLTGMTRTFTLASQMLIVTSGEAPS